MPFRGVSSRPAVSIGVFCPELDFVGVTAESEDEDDASAGVETSIGGVGTGGASNRDTGEA